MKTWQVILVIIALVLLLLLLIPRLRLISLFSPQGTVSLEQLTGTFNTAKTKAYFNNRYVAPPAMATADSESGPVLGESSSSKRIEIDLANQRLYAFDGNNKIYDFLISSGKWGRTPTGRFRIWTKLRYTLMTGGSQAIGTYYYLPNVPYTMFFYNDATPKYQGYGIHGTYWHSNFGHPMSHGCINMKTEEVAQLFYWAQPELSGRQSVLASNVNPGTEIVIYGDAPNE